MNRDIVLPFSPTRNFAECPQFGNSHSDFVPVLVNTLGPFYDATREFQCFGFQDSTDSPHESVMYSI